MPRGLLVFSRNMNRESSLALRIIVEQPPPGVRFAVQLGKHDLLAPTETADGLAFDVAVRCVIEARAVRLLGPAAQGPPAARFLYVNSGTLAAQAGSCWTRRAKVSLTSINEALVRAHLENPGSRLEVRIPGVGRDGGPSCGSVRLSPDAWRVVPKASTR